MGVEVPKLVERLREVFKGDENKPLTRRTGWKLVWDVRRSKVTITESDGKTWEQKVGELPPNVQGKTAILSSASRWPSAAMLTMRFQKSPLRDSRHGLRPSYRLKNKRFYKDGMSYLEPFPQNVHIKLHSCQHIGFYRCLKACTEIDQKGAR
jgi:hypothetical protein